jgi:hypothetical protein
MIIDTIDVNVDDTVFVEHEEYKVEKIIIEIFINAYYTEQIRILYKLSDGKSVKREEIRTNIEYCDFLGNRIKDIKEVYAI